MARWDGSAWSPLSGGVGSRVQALAEFDDGIGKALYARVHFWSMDGDECW